MDTASTATPAPAPATNWPLLLLFAILLGGGLYALNFAFTRQAALNHQLAEQNAALKTRLAALEATQQSALQHVVTTDALDALQTSLAAKDETIAALDARVKTLEQTVTAPAAVFHVKQFAGSTETLQQFLALKQAVQTGAPFPKELEATSTLPQVKDIVATLEPFAATGVASDATLRQQLAELVKPVAATPETDPKFDTINNRLKGLLHIARKPAAPMADVYATLRAQAENNATLDVLITSAEQLPADARAKLDAWLAAAKQRQTALTTIAAAEAALMKPAQ